MPSASHGRLSLRVGDKEYGVDLLHAQEIRCCDPPTRIAGASPFVNRIIDLRGGIVPAFDPRLGLVSSVAWPPSRPAARRGAHPIAA
jgi:chemotaxis signal transduction protein